MVVVMAKFRWKSKAFVSGLHEGFAAPSLFFFPTDYPRASKIDASVKSAWTKVGMSLNRATATVEIENKSKTMGQKRIVKSTGKGPRTEHRISA